MSIKKLQQMEALFEKNGNLKLATACKAIVGSDGSNGILKSIDEDAIEETMGVPKTTWLEYKITILECKEEFENECKKLGLNPNNFLDEIQKEIK